jgi:hypothetical protein
VLDAGYDVVISDLDTVWFRDPLAYVEEHVPPGADLVVASDQVGRGGARAGGALARASLGGLLRKTPA